MSKQAATPLGFGDDWFALGIVDKCLLDLIVVVWEQRGRPDPAYYRFVAFHRFLWRAQPLTTSLAAALYDLGAGEAHASFGASMMKSVLRREECPEELLRRALAADHPGVVHVAMGRLNLSYEEVLFLRGRPNGSGSGYSSGHL